MEMHTGTQSELPPVLIIIGCPRYSEGGPDCSVGAFFGQPIENETPREAAGTLPGITRDFHAKGISIARAGARLCRRHDGDQAGDRQVANRNSP
jgi:hypothetical protein